jgi:pyridoxine 5'-phosphate synthase PdxJ
LQRSHRDPQKPDIVPERRAEAAGLEKVALHINDDERRLIQIDRQ